MEEGLIYKHVLLDPYMWFCFSATSLSVESMFLKLGNWAIRLNQVVLLGMTNIFILGGIFTKKVMHSALLASLLEDKINNNNNSYIAHFTITVSMRFTLVPWS